MSGIELAPGLWTPQQPERAPLWQPGTPDVDEPLGVTMQILSELGALRGLDTDKKEQEIKEAFANLAVLGYKGRLYLELATENVSFEALLAFAEGKKPENVREQLTAIQVCGFPAPKLKATPRKI